MMVILLSDNVSLNRQCRDLLGGKKNVKQLYDVNWLKRQVFVRGDIVIIDLQWCREKDLPAMKAPAIALADIPIFEQAMRLLRKGVRGYGNRYMNKANFLQAVTAIRSGQVWLPPSIVNQMITAIPDQSPGREPVAYEKLSKREEEVARLVATGLTNKELAETMNITVRTVKAHLTSIFSKTGYRDRLELALQMKSNENTLTR